MSKTAKKLTLSELAEKHGVPRYMTKPQRDAILKIPASGDFRQRGGGVSTGLIKKLRNLSVIERSPRLTCCSGSMLWVMTSTGSAYQSGIKAMNKEREKQNEQSLQPS